MVKHKHRPLLWFHLPKIIFLGLTVLSLFTVSLLLIFKDFHSDYYANEQIKEFKMIQNVMEDLISNRQYGMAQKLCDIYSRTHGVYFYITSTDDQIIANNLPKSNNKLEMATYSTSLRDSSYEIIAKLELRYSKKRFIFHRYNIYFKIFIILCFFIIILTWGGFGILNETIPLLKEIAEGSLRFSEGSFGKKIVFRKEKIPLEMFHVKNSLNSMAEQIDDKVSLLAQQKNVKEVILNSMDEGVLTVDFNGKILLINNKLKDFFNLDQNTSYEGYNFKQKIEHFKLHEIFKKIIDDGQDLDCEVNVQNKIMSCRGCLLLDVKKQMMGVLFVFGNLTRIRKIENYRKNFISNVSHELKTPLTVIQGYIETLIDDNSITSVTKKKFFDIILNHSKDLEHIIDRLLILSKVENYDQAKGTIQFSRMNVSELLEKVSNLHQLLAREKRIRIINKSASDVQINANNIMIQQAVSNLLDNAIKFSPEGSIIVMGSSAEDGYVKIFVMDEGDGVPFECRDNVFDRFYSISNKEAPKFLGGSGLGLSIVKKIVEIHGAEVSYIPNIPRGSVFQLTFSNDN